jgi:hypothetical protein
MKREETGRLRTEAEILAEFEGEDAELAGRLLGLRQDPGQGLVQRIEAIAKQEAAENWNAGAEVTPPVDGRQAGTRPAPTKPRWAIPSLLGRLAGAAVVGLLVIAAWAVLRGAAQQGAFTAGPSRDAPGIGIEASAVPSDTLPIEERVEAPPDPSAPTPVAETIEVTPLPIVPTPTPPLTGEVTGLDQAVVQEQEATVEAYLRALGMTGEAADYEAAYALLTPERRSQETLETFSTLGDSMLASFQLLNYWSMDEGTVRTSSWVDGEKLTLWEFDLQQTSEGWRVAAEAMIEGTKPVGPTPADAAREAMRMTYGEAWMSNFRVLLEEPWQEGQIIMLFMMAPQMTGARADEWGRAVPFGMTVYAQEGEEGWEVSTVGAWFGEQVGDAFQGRLGQYDISLGAFFAPSDEVAFYGIVERADIARVEMVEENGTRHSADVGEEGAFFLPTSEEWLMAPEIHAYDAAGNEIMARTNLIEPHPAPPTVPVQGPPMESATPIPTPPEWALATPTPYIPTEDGSPTQPPLPGTATPLPTIPGPTTPTATPFDGMSGTLPTPPPGVTATPTPAAP